VAVTRPTVIDDDIERMSNGVLLSYGKDSSKKYSAYWILLLLSGVIATAGVVGDSTAVVIGAMIVAPLMTPILGTALALVLADRNRMLRSLSTVIGGALMVIAVGYGAGLLDPVGSLVENNGQITARVSPRLLDLIAALATGTVGAFALVRSDISDTLPGVAIAISLVPPLAVVGLTFEAGNYGDALGATLLFLTNVTAIIFTATIVLLIYQVRDVAERSGHPVGNLSGSTLAVVVLTVLAIAVPLSISTANLVDDTLTEHEAATTVNDWARDAGWKIIDYEVLEHEMEVTALGPAPRPSSKTLREALDTAGFADINLVVNLVEGGQAVLPGTG